MKNLYGVHMLEETGGWDGYEKTVDPNYKLPTTNTPNIRKYNRLLQKDTGLDMDMEGIWNTRRTVCLLALGKPTISSAAAHKDFCDYIHKKYPGLKAFQFEGLPECSEPIVHRIPGDAEFL